jgi:hypothetical protein
MGKCWNCTNGSCGDCGTSKIQFPKTARQIMDEMKEEDENNG